MAELPEPPQEKYMPLKRGFSLEDNLSRQAAEIEVLNSILEGDVEVVREKEEFRVAIYIESPSADGLNVLTPLAPSGNSSENQLNSAVQPQFQRQASTDGRPCYPISVHHLPPLQLYVAYHDRYPSDKAPYFDLNAQWLDRRFLPTLKEKMSTLFNPGCEFVYEAVEYLRSEFLEFYLSLQSEHHTFLLEGAYSKTETPVGPDRDSSPTVMFVRSASVMADMEEFDKYQNHKQFLDNSHLCDICTEEKKGLAFPEASLLCGHLFCTSCLAEYAQVQLNTGGVARLRCPDPQCDTFLSPTMLQCVLDEQQFERYEHLMLEFVLETTPGVVYCPRPGCQSRVFSEPEDSLAVCDVCRYPFCKNCNHLWHAPQPCRPTAALAAQTEGSGSIEDEILKLQASEKSVPEAKKKELISDLQATLWVASNPTRKCPGCGYVVVKNGGCNKMSCIRCGTCFCWLCGQRIGGYGHFDSSPQCQLFRDEDYQPPQETRNITDEYDIDDPGVLEVLLHPKCPKCQADNPKDYVSRDNMLTCAMCHFRYCFICLEPCFGVYHFNEYGCTRFTSFEVDSRRLRQEKKDAEAN